MRGVVVAPQPIAVEEGSKVLRGGGNAVDAAVTCAFVQMVADPQMGGIGGHGIIHLFRRNSGEKFMITFQTEAPAAASEMMFTPENKEISGGFYLVKNHENQIGYKAVGVPGFLKGVSEVMRRYGTISWKDAILPAVHLARKGFPVHDDWYQVLIRDPREGEVDHITRLNATSECARIYLKNGAPYRPGEILTLTDCAHTLERIAHEGPEVFTRGEIAEIIEFDFKKNGGLLTRADLDQYQPEITPPVQGEYRGYKILTTPYPGAGVLLIFMLNILEGFDLGKMELNSPEYIHLIARTQDIVFSERAKVWGDPKSGMVPMEKLISKAYADECRQRVEQPWSQPVQAVLSEEDTTHVTVVDQRGDIALFTHSLGVSAGVVVPGLGFLFNNGMCRFDPKPGRPNSVAPRKRRPSNNTPTIVFKGDKPLMALGASGGFGIIDGVLQSIINVIDHKMDILEAVSAPRVHSENNRIVLENRIPEETCGQLQKMGHRVLKRPYSYHRSFGNVQAVSLDWEKDAVAGASCPRRGGMALYA